MKRTANEGVRVYSTHNNRARRAFKLMMKRWRDYNRVFAEHGGQAALRWALNTRMHKTWR